MTNSKNKQTIKKIDEKKNTKYNGIFDNQIYFVYDIRFCKINLT